MKLNCAIAIIDQPHDQPSEQLKSLILIKPLDKLLEVTTK